MLSYLVRRVLMTIPVVLGVSTLTFFLIHFVPGDPVDIMLGDQATSVDKEALRQELGLHEPVYIQYKNFFKNLLSGDLGRSLASRRPVLNEILERIPATLELTISAVIFGVIAGIFLGTFSAASPTGKVEIFSSVYGLLAMSTPGFCLAPLLILIFSVQLDWLPVSERDGFSSLVLPTVSLGIGLSAIILKMTKASMTEVLKEDYIRFAKAKGLGPFKIFFKHALRNAIVPVLTIIGLQFGALMAGAVITETIFDWPGVGTLFYGSIQQRNYPLVQGCVLFISFSYVVVNTLTDIAYTLANPKVRL